MAEASSGLAIYRRHGGILFTHLAGSRDHMQVGLLGLLLNRDVFQASPDELPVIDIHSV